MTREEGETDAGPLGVDFPEGLVANVSDAGGVVSASVEETNRVRAALGLKPLAEGSARGEAGRREAAAGAAARAEASRADAAAELASRVAEARERRELADTLRGQKTLADDDAAGDDAAAWIERSRKLAASRAEAARRDAAKAAAARRAAALDEQDEVDSDEDTRPQYTSKDLEGLKVFAGADDLAEGETMVLTLKDSRIIGDDGAVDGGEDTLENVRLTELRSRERARAAAKRGPAGPGATLVAAEEEGPRRLLAKYDDAEAPEGMSLDADGAIDAAKRAREAEVRRRLAAAAAGVAGGAVAESAATAAGEQADFFSPAEMAAFAAPKKLRKKKKLRPRPVTADELLPLDEDEETAKMAGADHGSRARAGSAPGGGAAAAAADAGWARFDAAKAKAAEATARLIGTRSAPAGEGGDADEADAAADEDAALAAAMERSRRAAAAAASTRIDGASTAGIAARIAAERVAASGAAAAGGGAGGVMFTDTQEFVRTISVDRARARAEAAQAEAELTGIVGATVLPPAPDAADGDDDDDDGAAAPKARRPYRERGEAAAAAVDEPETIAGGGGMMAPPPRDPTGRGGVAELANDAQATGAKARGLAATLALLKDKGALSEGVTWAGRTNDKKKDRIAVAVEADAIGTADPRYNFNFKLDRFDEFGRKMTPKEAFRELCHKFHGIFPSRGKQEARLRQWHEEQARLKAGTGDTALESAEKLRAAQLRTATPFVVLSGSIKSAQVTDASSRYATADRAEVALAAPARGGREEEDAGGYGAVRPAAAPNGGAPPLEGAEKVRFMLGMPGAAGAKRGAGGAAGAHAAKRQRTADE